MATAAEKKAAKEAKEAAGKTPVQLAVVKAFVPEKAADNDITNALGIVSQADKAWSDGKLTFNGILQARKEAVEKLVEAIKKMGLRRTAEHLTYLASKLAPYAGTDEGMKLNKTGKSLQFEAHGTAYNLWSRYISKALPDSERTRTIDPPRPMVMALITLFHTEYAKVITELGKLNQVETKALGGMFTELRKTKKAS
jgi:hypothetical protein